MKKFLFIIVCIVALVLAIVITAKITKKDTKITNDIKNEAVSNTSTNTAMYQNETKNEINNTSVQNKTVENEIPISNNDIYEENSEVGTTEKKEEAIKLAKEKWGPDNTVSFRCDSVTSKGEYIIAVVSKETATVSTYFIVNLENKTVEVDY